MTHAEDISPIAGNPFAIINVFLHCHWPCRDPN